MKDHTDNKTRGAEVARGAKNGGFKKKINKYKNS